MSNTQGSCYQRMRGYELLMRQTELSGEDIPEDFMCGRCIHHRPDWEYRYCELTECPYIKGQLTFREQYLEKEEGGRL